MKNTSALYIVAGVLIGFIFGRTSTMEPVWPILFVPAAAALISAVVVDHSR